MIVTSLDVDAELVEELRRPVHRLIHGWCGGDWLSGIVVDSETG
jgi:hypothetical protein